MDNLHRLVIYFALVFKKDNLQCSSVRMIIYSYPSWGRWRLACMRPSHGWGNTGLPSSFRPSSSRRDFVRLSEWSRLSGRLSPHTGDWSHLHCWPRGCGTTCNTIIGKVSLICFDIIFVRLTLVAQGVSAVSLDTYWRLCFPRENWKSEQNSNVHRHKDLLPSANIADILGYEIRI